jgi:NADH-quinone oxidoreductase subunit A
MGYQFGAVLAFAIMAVLFAAAILLVGRFLRPRFPNDDKLSIYECGERPIGSAWYNFNPRFYLIALAFIIFEVDIALTFPVVVVYAAWVKKGTGWVAFVELILFTVVLLVGLAWLPEGAVVTPDHEHDEFAWWPAEVDLWPPEADEPLRRMAEMLADA